MNAFSRYLATQIQQGRLDKDKALAMYPEYAAEVKELLEQWKDDSIPLVED